MFEDCHIESVKTFVYSVFIWLSYRLPFFIRLFLSNKLVSMIFSKYKLRNDVNSQWFNLIKLTNFWRLFQLLVHTLPLLPVLFFTPTPNLHILSPTYLSSSCI